MKCFAIIALGLFVMSGCDMSPSAPATTKQPVNTGAAKQPVNTGDARQPDNTGVNTRDRSSAAKTPLDQNESKADVGITADIRKQIVATKMSVNAQNVKVITQDGKVTLRGPVKTDDEKQQIEDIAMKVAGAGNVSSELEVENER